MRSARFFFPSTDTIASLSRSRSVGSVDVAGVGTSILQSASVNHQQSSLSLNDMEQLEEAHLQGKRTRSLRPRRPIRVHCELPYFFLRGCYVRVSDRIVF